MDEFSLVLLAGLTIIVIMMFVWTKPSEAPPWVEPLSVSLSILNGTSSTFMFDILGELTNVTLSGTGQISTWMSFNKNNFNVVNSTKVTVTVKVPGTTEIGLYTGGVKVKSPGGEKTISVNVDVQNVTKISSRSISLGSFSVEYTPGAKILDSKESLDVIGGYITSYPVNLAGTLTDEEFGVVKGGFVQLRVSETNYAGSLIVSINGKEVFDEIVSVGEITIPIDTSDIKKSNTVTIRASSPGWKFWMSTVYKIKNVKFGVSLKPVSAPQNFTFILDSSEVNNFDSFVLSYRVKEYTPLLPEMLIRINDQIVYAKAPPMAILNESFKKDILGNNLYLDTGDNTISFSFEKEGHYVVDSARLTVYYKG